MSCCPTCGSEIPFRDLPTYDPTTWTATRYGTSVTFTAQEGRLFGALLDAWPRTLLRSHLEMYLWPDRLAPETGVAVYAHRVRYKVASLDIDIEGVKEVGYRMILR